MKGGLMQNLHPLDYVVIGAYFGIIIFIGMFFSRFIKQAKDYFAAGAAVPWWLAGISLWMASFSALMFIIYSELAFKYGFVANSMLGSCSGYGFSYASFLRPMAADENNDAARIYEPAL